MQNENLNINHIHENERSIELKKPKKWKSMLLVWITIYPLLNIFFPLLMPYIGQFSLSVRLLIMTIIIVPIMGFILGKLNQHFHLWLRK